MHQDEFRKAAHAVVEDSWFHRSLTKAFVSTIRIT